MCPPRIPTLYWAPALMRDSTADVGDVGSSPVVVTPFGTFFSHIMCAPRNNADIIIRVYRRSTNKFDLAGC